MTPIVEKRKVEEAHTKRSENGITEAEETTQMGTRMEREEPTRTGRQRKEKPGATKRRTATKMA